MLSGCTLQAVGEKVDLMVSLASHLSWNTQTQKVVNKVNNIVGFRKRIDGPRNKEVFSPPLGFTHSGIYCPNLVTYLQNNIGALERVQRRAFNHVFPMSSTVSSYKERLAMLRWSSLQSRRSILSLRECYKTIHGFNGLNCNDYFEFNCSRRTRSNH